MLRLPPPSRVAIGYVLVGGQRQDVFLNTEWARYFESLNTQVDVTSSAVGQPGAPGTTGAAGVGVSLSDEAGSSLEFIPGPPGAQGAKGDAGLALLMLQEQSVDEMPFVPHVPVYGTIATVTNDNAAPGFVGEYSSTTFSGVGLTTSVSANLASMSLTPGDWDVSGGVSLVGSVSNMSNAAFGASTTSLGFGSSGTYHQITGSVMGNIAGAIPVVRLSLSATTTVFLVALASFASGTASASGIFRARRVR
jgi:hypothetical protein